MGVRPVDLDTFEDLPPYQLFEHQSLLNFLYPSKISFYPRVVCDFYANSQDSKDDIGYVTMVQGHEISFTD